jgi:hypothetical protein
LLSFILYTLDLFLGLLFKPNEGRLGGPGANEPVQFAWIAALSRFWEFWITNTIKKVMTLVTVLAMSCHAYKNLEGTGQMRRNATQYADGAMNITAGTRVVGTIPLDADRQPSAGGPRRSS